MRDPSPRRLRTRRWLQNRCAEAACSFAPATSYLEAAGLDLGALFRSHGLVSLAQEKVFVLIGTDGGGVEHSRLSQEYQRAAEVLRSLRSPLTVEQLLDNQRWYLEQISSHEPLVYLH